MSEYPRIVLRAKDPDADATLRAFVENNIPDGADSMILELAYEGSEQSPDLLEVARDGTVIGAAEANG